MFFGVFWIERDYDNLIRFGVESKAFSRQCRVTMVIIFSATALAIENRCGSKKNHFGNIGHIGGCNVAFKDYGKLPFAPAAFS